VALASVLSRYAPADATPEAVSRGPSGIDESYLRLLVDSLGAAKVGHLISELPDHRVLIATGWPTHAARQISPDARRRTRPRGMAANLGSPRSPS